MSFLKWWIPGTLLILLGIFGVMLLRSGFWRQVEIRVLARPELRVWGQALVGPYNQINKPLTDIEHTAKKLKIDCSKTLAHFLDDPQEIDHERLRSFVGCLIENDADWAKLTRLTHAATATQGGIRETYVIPAHPVSLWAHFDGSPAIGPFRVYPQLFERARQERLSLRPERSFEIYSSGSADHEFYTEYWLDAD